MNKGARVANGEYLCFLHADTTVPTDLVRVIVQTLNQPKIACGGFVSIMRGKQNIRWFTSFLNYTKTFVLALLYRPHLFFSRGFRVLFGDQVIFCRKDNFIQSGGFNETLPILEEVDFCRRIVRYGRITQINRIVESSDRRVSKLGFVKSHIIYSGIVMMWAFGVSPVYLKKLYEDVR
jgi:GT2 family glycosyltransferase